jgi:16S rRNA A1518/A1519 N6-dimethyltransferase RsmA/KsgA/DIM1 with predicted DNA glycosylase/AP lyase activity
VLSDQEIAALADPHLGQHFLVSAEKLSLLVAAAGIRPTDDVLEVGAGIGTVARVLPPCRSLTVVELDPRLISFLRRKVPHAKVLHGDALEIIRDASFDVLIGNLPHAVTESLLKVLPGLSFRTAVMAVSDSSDLGQLAPAFSVSEVTRVTGDDFVPPQPSVSHVVKVVPARQPGDGQ